MYKVKCFVVKWIEWKSDDFYKKGFKDLWHCMKKSYCWVYLLVELLWSLLFTGEWS